MHSTLLKPAYQFCDKDHIFENFKCDQDGNKSQFNSFKRNTLVGTFVGILKASNRWHIEC